MQPSTEYETLPDDQYMPEKFPVPRTYPNGRNMENAYAEKASQMKGTTSPVEQLGLEWEPEKFPKPNTYPGAWDISEICKNADSRK